MLYLATIRHTTRQCPGVESDTFKEFIARFSSDQFSKARVRVVSAYIDQSCLNGLSGRDHVTTFALDADSAAKVKTLLGPMGADVRQVLSWQMP